MDSTVKLLVIDDEDVVLLSIKRILRNDRNFNYKIDTAHSAEEGLELFEAGEYNVIISDIVMPGMSGLSLIPRMIGRKRNTKIILITGFATMKTALQAMRRGAFDYIAKPFTNKELRSSIYRALRSGSPDSHKILETLNDIPEDMDVIEAGKIFSIRGHTWALIEKDFSVKIGIEKEFLSGMQGINGLELMEYGEHVSQGQGFGRIITNSEEVYNMPSPFSGRILESNSEALEQLKDHDNLDIGEIWLIKIDPTDMEKEAGNLS